MTTESQEQVVQPAGTTPAAAAPAAVASAAAPAAQAQTPADTQPEVYEYNEVPDDPGLNMALKFIGGQGLGLEHPAVQAAIKGDFSFLRAELATRGDKARGYEEYLKLAEKSYAKHVNDQTAREAEAAQLIHQTVGGEENWKTIQEWAKANAEDGERKAINAMLNAGGFQARAAATLLQTLYAGAQGTVVEPASAVRNGVPANGASAAQAALSPADFQTQFAALVAKVGVTAAGKSPEYRQLVARRQAYRG